jgi:hypothetical protein
MSRKKNKSEIHVRLIAAMRADVRGASPVGHHAPKIDIVIYVSLAEKAQPGLAAVPRAG